MSEKRMGGLPWRSTRSALLCALSSRAINVDELKNAAGHGTKANIREFG
jgi:hypothetical protein